MRDAAAIVNEPIRRARSGTIRLFLLTHFALSAIINLVFFETDAFRPLASATGGLLNGSLVANVVFLVMLTGWVMLRRGGLRPYDIGLIPRHIGLGIVFTLAFWGAAQLVHLIAGVLATGEIRLHPYWGQPGVSFMIGQVLAQLIGNALFEEIAYRAFLFPQLYLYFERHFANPWRRLFAALFVSQAAFALSHIPNRIYRGMTPESIALDLLLLGCWGMIYTVMYLRTDNLFVVVGAHTMGNVPTTLFATAPFLAGDGATVLIYVMIAAAIFLYPIFRAARPAAAPRADAANESGAVEWARVE
jgi:membrane protease YdiL (CAAX protease family)